MQIRIEGWSTSVVDENFCVFFSALACIIFFT